MTDLLAKTPRINKVLQDEANERGLACLTTLSIAMISAWTADGELVAVSLQRPRISA